LFRRRKKLSCGHVLQLLERYCDGEIEEGERYLVAEHLGRCRECPKREDFILRLKDLVRRKCGGLAELPPELADRVRQLIRSA
jgi:anti-sigma factor (TIGR02949 family)